MGEIKVIRGAKIVRVTENELDKYLSKGYEIYGEKLGSESTQPTPKVEPIKSEPVIKPEPKPNTSQATRRNRKK